MTIHGHVDIRMNAAIVCNTGSVYIENGGVVDDFGYFYIRTYSTLYVQSGGEIRVYRDIYTSGRMYGGGKILMLRREGRIKDRYGNNLFKLNQAYGFWQQQIA